jgi:integral membrane protein
VDVRSLFVLVARAEGVSTLLLFFVAMPLKYGAGMPHATQGPGWLHGALFLTYLVALLAVTVRERWGLGTTLLGFVVAFLPFGTFWFERHLPHPAGPVGDDEATARGR